MGQVLGIPQPDGVGPPKRRRPVPPKTKLQMELNRLIGMIKYHDTWDPLLDTLGRDLAEVCTIVGI